MRGEAEAVACAVAADPDAYRARRAQSLVLERGAARYGAEPVDHPLALVTAYVWSAHPTIGVETRRTACIRRCGYCPYAFIDRSLLGPRRGGHVLETIERLHDMGVRSIFFTDAVFNDDPELAKKLLRGLVRAALPGLTWSAYFVPAHFDDELAALIADSGNGGVIFSPDSFHRPTMRYLGKSFSLQRVRIAHEICHRHKLTARWSLLFGLPFETAGSVRETASVANAEFSEHEIGLFVGVRLLPGTRYASQLGLPAGRLIAPVFYPVRTGVFGWISTAFEQRFLDVAGAVRLLATRVSLSQFAKEPWRQPLEEDLPYVLVRPMAAA